MLLIHNGAIGGRELIVQVCNALTLYKPYTKQGAFRRKIFLLDMTDEHVNNQMSLLINILCQRCQWGMCEFGGGEIIKANNGNVIRHAVVKMIQRLDQLSGYTVGCTEECGGCVRTLKQILQHSGIVDIGGGGEDEIICQSDVISGQPFSETLQTMLINVALIDAVGDEGEAFMSHLCKIVTGQLPAGNIVHTNMVSAGNAKIAIGKDGGHCCEGLDVLQMTGEGTTEDCTGDIPAAQVCHDVPIIVGGADQREIAVPVKLNCQSTYIFGGVGIAKNVFVGDGLDNNGDDS